MLRSVSLRLGEESRNLYERFVPPKHPLRQLDEALDFSFILDLVARHYCKDYGRPAEHPERMWRLLFAQYFLNLSDEKICLAAHDTMSLRLFLRLNVDEQPVHPSTLQRFRFQRLQEGDYLQIHFALLRQAQEKGLLDPRERQIFDTTHVRSNTRVVSLAKLLMEARDRVVREVRRIEPALGQALAQRAEEAKAAYRQERDTRRAEGRPKPDKEEKIASAALAVAKTLREVTRHIQARDLEPTERLNVALAVLEKVIADRQEGAKERLVSVHDTEARKGKKGFGNWDGRKLALNLQEDSRLIVAAEMAPANRNDCELVEPLLDQQQGTGITPEELTADKGADYGPLRSSLKDRGILAHVPITTPTNGEGQDLFKPQDFIYDPEGQTLT